MLVNTFKFSTYLVVSESDFNFKFGWHDELVRFNRVIVVLVLLCDLEVVLSSHLLLLHLHLLYREVKID